MRRVPATEIEALVIQSVRDEGASTLEVPWQKTPARRRREILLPKGIRPGHARPIRSETRARLVAAIARGRRWLDELIADPTASANSIAKRENCSARKINHDNLASFPCTRSRQSGHRWPAPPWYGGCSPHRLAGGMVPAAPGARPSWAIITHTRTESLSVVASV